MPKIQSISLGFNMALPTHRKRTSVDGRIRSKKYLAFLRTLPCLGCSLEGRTQAHHIRHHEPSSIGLRHGDQWAVPLCDKCHNELHAFGAEELWWDCQGLDAEAWCERSYEAYKGTGQHE